MPPLVRSFIKPWFIWPKLDLFLSIKRGIDIFCSILLLILCVPIAPFAIYLLKFRSPGPILYKQQRGGLNGKQFTIYKLRTMYSHLCDDGREQVVYKDPRITRFGKFLRHYSIDELPQLYNVLIGDMSLIGPRPHAVPMDEYYCHYIPHYNDRYQIKPGITGLAQINGARGETPIIHDMEQRIAHDIEYIQNKSLWLDFKIFLKTCKVVFFTKY